MEVQLRGIKENHFVELQHRLKPSNCNSTTFNIIYLAYPKIISVDFSDKAEVKLDGIALSSQFPTKQN